MESSDPHREHPLITELEALVATAAGLLVAIPAVMLFNAFNARVESYQIDMNDVASELIDFVLKEGRYT